MFYTYFAACGLDVRVETPPAAACGHGRDHPAADLAVRVQNTKASKPGAALRQMHDRGYPDKYRSHGLPILLVGIAFNPETRSIADYQTATA